MKELNMNAVWIQLTDHIKSKHEEDRYECDQCEYKASDKGNLSKHKTWMS